MLVDLVGYYKRNIGNLSKHEIEKSIRDLNSIIKVFEEEINSERGVA